MKSTLKSTYEEAKRVILYAETKRIAENLTKMEVCQILDINNNYYINCISGRVAPSQSIVDSLTEYIEMSTDEVYKRVFAFRSSKKYNAKKSDSRFMIVNNMFKEKYHESWNMDENGFVSILKEVKNHNERLSMPTG